MNWHVYCSEFSNKTAPYFEDWTPDANFNSRGYNHPTYGTDKPESVRCGRGNMDHAADTEVLTVRAGDTIEVAHSRYDPTEWAEHVIWDNCPDGRGSCVVSWDPAIDIVSYALKLA